MQHILFLFCWALVACVSPAFQSTLLSPAMAPGPVKPSSQAPSTPPSSSPVVTDTLVTDNLSTNNLIINPGAEQAAVDTTQPLDWNPNSWGMLNAHLSWQSTGSYSGQRYLAVTIQNYQAGDAKWIFTPLSLEKNQWYEYSDAYRSDGRNRLVSSCQTPDGKRYYQTLWQTHRSEHWQIQRVRFYHSDFRDCKLTIMHLLDREGWLHTDHHRLRKVEAQPLRRPLVSVTFDDVWTSAATRGSAELEKRGWRGSFYVAGQFARLPDAPHYASAAMIQQLIAHGHEIGSHSHSHTLMSTLNTHDIIQELQSNYAYL